MNKSEELQKLKEEMLKDESLPLKKGATNLVFGVRHPETKILLIGEGPGFNEDRLGEPFVGNAGKLLDSLLQSTELPRKDVYITNVVHHRPPENRDPLPAEISAYGVYLDKIINIINPKVIVTLGRFSMAKFLPGVFISSIRGNPKIVNWMGKDIVVIAMYHPAAALRRGDVMSMIKDDFRKLPEILKEANKQEIIQMNLI